MLGERHHFIVQPGVVTTTNDLNFGNAFGNSKRSFKRVGETAIDTRLLHKSVNDNLDGVLLVSSKLDLVGQFVKFAVDDRSGEPLRSQIGQQRVVGALATAHDWGQDLELGAIGKFKNPIDDLLRSLPLDDRAVDRTMRNADARIEKSEVVVDLGNRAHGGTGVS